MSRFQLAENKNKMPVYAYRDNKYQKSKVKNNKKRKHARESSSDSSDDDTNPESGFYQDCDVSCKDNRIYFKTQVDDNSIEKLVKIIEFKNKKFKNILNNEMVESATAKPLYLHITSYGGSLLSCFRGIDAIKRSYIPIYTVVDGYAASAATLLSVVGKKRYMTPNSYMLIHQLSGANWGKFWEIKDEYENCEMWMNDIYNIYISNTKMKEDELKEFLSHDTWWKSDKCVEYGLVDDIYEGDDILKI